MSTESDKAFDQALITSAFKLAGERGWLRMTLADAARAADLPIDRVRERFPHRLMVLQRFGQMLDGAALQDTQAEGSARDALFDMLMRRFDLLHANRDGVLALLDALPLDPGGAVTLACGTGQSMRWLLDAAGISTSGLTGELRVKGLTGVWLWGLRAWRNDTSPDLSATMVALDTALRRAEEFAGWLGGRDSSTAAAGDSEPGATSEDGSGSQPDASQPV